MTQASQHQLGRHVGGWNPSRPDHRDRIFNPTLAARLLAPRALALDITGIPQLDQGEQGACTGHGGAGLIMFDQKQQGQPVVVPSRAMIYYDARIPEGTTSTDAGAAVRDMVAGLVKYGVCPDSEFPYNDKVWDRAPSKRCYADGQSQDALVYETVRYPHVNAALASGFPVVFGFTVFESFESPEVARTGIVPIPEPGEQVLGGHCCWLWAFNSSRSSFTAPSGHILPPRSKTARNSWAEPDGTPWGDNGSFHLPQWYWDQGLCSDHWIIKRIGARS